MGEARARSPGAAGQAFYLFVILGAWLAARTRRAEPEGDAAMPDVLDAAGLVAYAEGSIVSRALVNRDTGSVTAFAFDKGTELSEHRAPFEALVQVLDGEAEIILDGAARRVKAGQLLLMPPGAPHALKAVERFKMLLFLARAKA